MTFAWPPGMPRPVAPPEFEQPACRGKDPNLWFPERGESPETARQICAGCPHLFECREFGLANPALPGVWGGLSQRERRQAHKLALRGAPAVTSQLDEIPANTSNGHAPQTEVRASPYPAGRVCALVSCGQSVDGKSRYCSPRHQRQAKEQRARDRNGKPQVATVTPDTARIVSGAQRAVQPELSVPGGVFGHVQAVIGAFGPGSRLEVRSANLIATFTVDQR